MKLKFFLFSIIAIFGLFFIYPTKVSAQNTHSNILFMPGLMGSNLYRDSFFGEDKLWIPTFRQDVRQLQLSPEGESQADGVFTRDLVINIIKADVYKGIAEHFSDLQNTAVINTWKAAPYDWRFSSEKIASVRPLPPRVDLSTNQILIGRGGTVTLTWASEKSDSCIASGAWSGSKGSSGSEVSVRLFSQSIFILTCSNSVGSTTDSVTVNVRPPIFGEAAQTVTLRIGSEYLAGVQLQNEISYLDEQIENLASTSNTGKVTIVAHSYGGIVAKQLISRLEDSGRSNLVDRLILVSVPQIGTPQALFPLLHGEMNSMNILGRSNLRELAENSPSAYELLPHGRYFDEATSPLIEFSSFARSKYDTAKEYPSDIRIFSDMAKFLTGEYGAREEPAVDAVHIPNVLSTLLLDNATTTHAFLDAWHPPDGVEIVQIVGWGLDTVFGVKYNISRAGTLDDTAKTTKYGDGTVVLQSASFMNVPTYYFDLIKFNKENKKNISHAYILEAEPLQGLISSIISGVASSSPYISTSTPSQSISNIKSTKIDIHSPLAIDIFDEFGNHTGISTSTEPGSDLQFIDEEIPNSSYEEIGEGKYVHISTEDDHTILLTGTGTGTFTLDVTKTEGDEVVETYTFTDVSVSTTTRGFLTFRENGIPQIELINDGMSRFYNPDVLIDPDEIKVPNGLVGYWRFNEGAGTTTEDNSGNANIGILTPNITWITGTSSATSTHLKFGASQDFVSVQDSNSIDIDNSFTAAMWIKPTSTNDQLQTLLVKGPFNPGGRNYSLAINYGWSMKGLWAEIVNCNFYPIAELTQPIQLNKWQHVTLRYDHTSKKREIFLNGILVHSSTASLCTPLTNTQPLYIGGVPSSPWSGFSKFTGSIDEVRIYNRALLNSEIEVIKN